jgi:hypothetical protein
VDEVAVETFFPKHFDIPLSVYSRIIFITVRLLPEGQARKAMEHTNKAISYSFGFRVPFDGKLFHVFLVKNYGNWWTSAAKYLWVVLNVCGLR